MVVLNICYIFICLITVLQKANQFFLLFCFGIMVWKSASNHNQKLQYALRFPLPLSSLGRARSGPGRAGPYYPSEMLPLAGKREYNIAHMGPYGPVYHFISFLCDLYVVFTWFLDDFRWFDAWFGEFLIILKNHF